MKYKTTQGSEINIPIVGIVIGFVILGLLFSCFYIVSAGERGVVLTFGKPSMTAATEGIHFKIPIAQTVKKLEVRTQKIETEADSVTRDLQSVITIVALNYHVNPNEAPRLYQEVGMGYRERIINPSIQEAVKAVMARYRIEELTEKRQEVSKGIKEFLSERLGKYGMIVDDFNIINFGWSEEFRQSIEAKLTAEQKKLKAEMDLERIKIEKQQRITQAEAEAEALRLQKQVITLDLIRLRQIEVQRAAIEKWDGILPKVTGGAMPLVNLENLEDLGDSQTQ